MHVVDTEKGKPIVVKPEKEILDIANGIIQDNDLEEYADVIRRGALLANVSSLTLLSADFTRKKLINSIRTLRTGKIVVTLLRKKRRF
jgi:hypothetical protein